MEPLKLEEASRLLLDNCFPVCGVERVKTEDAICRVLAEDMRAVMDQPPFPRSPLDGYALRGEDIRTASGETPVCLDVIDEVTAGHQSSAAVTSGTAIRIMTGAPIPQGADCVVKQEDTDYGEGRVAVYKALAPWQNYCPAGEDYRAGDILLEKGTELRAVEIGILSGLGAVEVPVLQKLRVLLLSTGDEIVFPGEKLKPGQIYETNLHMLRARMRQWGAEVVYAALAPDDAEQIAAVIRQRIGDVDLIVTTGGVSVGKKDIMHDVLKILGAKRLFWRVGIKPGMPTLAGLYQDRLMVCLSGNPYGAIANLELLVRPVLAKMSGRKSLELKRKTAKLKNSYGKSSPVTRYIRAVYEDGQVRIAAGSNDSGILSTMLGCNCMVEVPAGSQGLEEGEQVWVVML